MKQLRMSPVNPKFKNKIIVARWQGYVDHIEDDHFVIVIKWVPLDKKEYRLKGKRHENDGYCEIKKSELGKDIDQLKLGLMLDWYIGHEMKPFSKRPVPFSKIVFWKKYSIDGKRLNMPLLKKRAKEWVDKMKNLKWD